MPIPAGSTIYRAAQNTGDSAITGGTVPSAMVIRLFADFQKYLEPEETPFSSSVSTGKSVNQKKIEWGTGFLAPHQVNLGATLTAGAATSLTLATGDGNKVQQGDVLRIPTDGGTAVEHVWITGVTPGSDVVTVVRAMGGTTAGAHTYGAPGYVIEILGPASQENADSQLAPIMKGAIEWNVPQLYDYAVQVSNREDNTPDYEFDGASRYDEFLSRIMTSASIDFEKAMIMGKRHAPESSFTVPGGTPTLMGGLDFFTDNSLDKALAPLTESDLRFVQRTLWTNVGSNAAKNILVGGFMREVISSLWNANRYATVKDDTTTLVWNAVTTEYGTLRFTMSRYIMPATVFFVNLDDISIRPYKGGEWADVQLPVNGPYKKGRFTGDYSAVFKKNGARYKIINCSTTATDYPNLA